MIVIDMEMPKCWDDCRFNYGCECSLTDAVCSDETSGENGEIPIFCPIKCDIDDIKAEILEETECHYGDKCLGANCPSNTDCMIMGEHAIWIIDKHIGKRRE